jgi:tetratricopeptide (TPR) repeat protein
MNYLTSFPIYNPLQSNQVILLEAAPGESRLKNIQEWLDEAAHHQGIYTSLISSDQNEGGPWAGLNQLLSTLLPQIQNQAPDLITQHDYELAHVLPNLRRQIKIRNLNLIDAPPEGEPELTYYPAIRVFRIIHGIVDLLKACHQRLGYSNWVIACDCYDAAGTLVQRFLSELIRRTGEQMHLTLLLSSSQGFNEVLTKDFGAQCSQHYVKLDISESKTPISKEVASHLAEEMAVQIGLDKIQQEIHLPKLIHYLLISDQPQKAVDFQIQAFVIYLNRGYYEDALKYGEAAFAGSKLYFPDDQEKYWEICEKLHDCYICLDKSIEAFHIMENALETTDNPLQLFHGNNRMAMLDTRYLREKRDLVQAEAYLEQGLKALENVELPEHEKFYLKALNRRGLALIRHLQGRFNEAVDLCISTYEETERIAGPNKYLAHQSLLQFNISRVYPSVGLPEKALSALTKAIEIDPHYSEYFNHRGNLYLKMGFLDKALNDYLKAIALSPPFPEALTNLAQCHRQMNHMADAVDAYSRSLDLDPNQSLALVGRAQAFEALEKSDLAILDYTAALALDSNQPLVLANRAILYFDAELYLKALEDLDQAIALSPETSDLYQNRAVALTALERIEHAIQDLQMYLNLSPDAEDRSEVEDKLLALQHAIVNV